MNFPNISNINSAGLGGAGSSVDSPADARAKKEHSTRLRGSSSMRTTNSVPMTEVRESLLAFMESRMTVPGEKQSAVSLVRKIMELPDSLRVQSNPKDRQLSIQAFDELCYNAISLKDEYAKGAILSECVSLLVHLPCADMPLAVSTLLGFVKSVPTESRGHLMLATLSMAYCLPMEQLDCAHMALDEISNVEMKDRADVLLQLLKQMKQIKNADRHVLCKRIEEATLCLDDPDSKKTIQSSLVQFQDKEPLEVQKLNERALSDINLSNINFVPQMSSRSNFLGESYSDIAKLLGEMQLYRGSSNR